MTTFRGDRLRALRLAAGYTQGQLAEHLGVTRPQVSNLESGLCDAKFSTAVEIAQVLGCSLEYLAGITKEPGSAYQVVDGRRKLTLVKVDSVKSIDN